MWISLIHFIDSRQPVDLLRSYEPGRLPGTPYIQSRPVAGILSEGRETRSILGAVYEGV